ncbi:hypothetical protein [Janibacter hoylei]|uniref:hypothetical protein n=1 Tax=Janibacter hoylei TaxID=364298 RepID=UPI00389A7E55
MPPLLGEPVEVVGVAPDDVDPASSRGQAATRAAGRGVAQRRQCRRESAGPRLPGAVDDSEGDRLVGSQQAQVVVVEGDDRPGLVGQVLGDVGQGDDVDPVVAPRAHDRAQVGVAAPRAGAVDDDDVGRRGWARVVP